MAFYRESCTIMVNIITEPKPVFKDRRKQVIQCFANEKNIFIIVLPLNFRISFFWKKDLNESFEAKIILF